MQMSILPVGLLLALLCSLKSNVMISTPLPSEIPKFFLNNFIQIDYNKPFSSMYYDTNVPSTLALSLLFPRIH